MTTYNSTSYSIAQDQLGVQPIAVTSTVQNHPFGRMVAADDPTYGEGQFIYLGGCASTVVGSVVTFNSSTGTTALASTSTPANALAVAMSANVAGQFGWYQVLGYNPNVLAATPCAANARVYLSATAGSLTTTSSSGNGVEGASVQVAVSNGVAGVQLNSPSSNGLS